MFSWFKKFKYETIAVRHHTINWTDDDGRITSNSKITYIFKVNGFEKRKVDTHTSDKVFSRGFHKDNTVYHTVVLPWLEHDPELEKENDPEPDPVKKDNLISIQDKLKHRKEKSNPKK